MRAAVVFFAFLGIGCSQDGGQPEPAAPAPNSADDSSKSAASLVAKDAATELLPSTQNDAAPPEPPSPRRQAAKPSTGPIDFPGRFPGAEEEVSVSLRWARSGKVELRAKPRRDAAVIATQKIRRGNKIENAEHNLLVLKPKVLTARQALEVPGAYIFDSANDTTSDHTVTVKLVAGQALEYFHYGSEGTAFVRVDKVVYLIDGLEWAEKFRGAKRGEPKPVSQQWWIRIGEFETDGAGWLEVKPSIVRAKVSGP